MGIFAGCQNQSFYRKMALNVRGVFQNARPEELEVLNINSLVLDSRFFCSHFLVSLLDSST